MPPKPGKDLKPTGSDKFIFRNGSKYEGEYLAQNGVVYRHGKGVYREALTHLDPYECPGIEPLEVHAELNQVFDGVWNLDQFEEGRVTFADGAYFEGKFDADGNYGEGKYVFKNGSVWEGPFRFCKMHGEGIFTDVAGRRWRGVMDDNSCEAMIEVR